MTISVATQPSDPITYTIVIDEHLRIVILNAVRHYSSLPEGHLSYVELQTAKVLSDMFDNDGTNGPLSLSPIINRFVL